MNFTDYATSRAEITENLHRGHGDSGWPADRRCSRPASTRASASTTPTRTTTSTRRPTTGWPRPTRDCCRRPKDLGVKYLHGNMSFASHVPACFNCGIVHPLEPSARRSCRTGRRTSPTTRTTPAEETHFYNSFYGPDGKFPYWPTNRTYAQILGLRDRRRAAATWRAGRSTRTRSTSATCATTARGKTLVTDWLDAVLAKYSALLHGAAAEPGLADAGRIHRAAAPRTSPRSAAGADAVYDRPPAPIDGDLAGRRARVTGHRCARTAGSTTYGTRAVVGARSRLTRAAASVTHHRPSLRPVKIALVSEGTYPYAMGGVSVWCDQLIRGCPTTGGRWWRSPSTARNGRCGPARRTSTACVSIPLWGGRPAAAGASGGRPPGDGAFTESVRGLPQGAASPRWTRGRDQAARSTASRFLLACAACTSTPPTAATWRAAMLSNRALPMMMDAWHAIHEDGLPPWPTRSRRPG